MPSSGPTRRGLLAGAAGAPLLLLAGARAADAAPGGDAAVLEAAFAREQAAALAYRLVARGGRLDARGRRIAEELAGHEQQHADALRTGLEALGVVGPPPPRSGAELERILPGLAAARDREGVLRYALGFEEGHLALYVKAAGRLQVPELLQTAVSIMASHGQHLAVLRLALGRPPAPGAFAPANGR